MAYEIVKGIEIPTENFRGKYKFERLEIGDGFYFDESEVKKIRPAAFKYAQKHGRRIVTRKQPDGRYLLVRTA